MKPLADPRHLYPRPPYGNEPQAPPGCEADMHPAADHGEASYAGNQLLQGRRALITGADSGIGRAVALAFAREGADVGISYLSEHDDARVTEKLVAEAGRKAVLLPGNLEAKQTCEEVAHAAVSKLGGIDILVNNAAFQRTFSSLDETADEDFVKTYEINVLAMFRMCRALLPQMQAGSSIINTASIQSFDPSPNLLAYASSKAAIASFTRSLAHIAIEQGVRVNAVAPGPVWTPLIPSTMEKEKVRTFGAHTAFGRAAQPAELAPIFVFLASAQASYVTGEVYGATGGQMPL
ncbi:SDR family oxidoreductase [Prosthecobacter sp.]|uniref:SDR family oxidoreductase n=1 Tax=Prosthecobacter sp. TaxID=1965333 RepID=UPI0037849A51